MTIPEITAYVMALTVEDVRRLTATEIMGWHRMSHEGRRLDDSEVVTPPWRYWWRDDEKCMYCYDQWQPDIDRNQSRMVTDKVIEMHGEEVRRHFDEVEGIRLMFWWRRTPDQESRAALIAHMLHAEESKNVK